MNCIWNNIVKMDIRRKKLKSCNKFVFFYFEKNMMKNADEYKSAFISRF